MLVQIEDDSSCLGVEVLPQLPLAQLALPLLEAILIISIATGGEQRMTYVGLKKRMFSKWVMMSSSVQSGCPIPPR